EFERAEVRDLHDLLALMLIDESSIPSLVKGAGLNTDDNSHIEFSAPRDLLAYAMQDADIPPPRTVQGRLLETIDHMVVNRPEGADEPAWLTGLAHALIRKCRFEEAKTVAGRAAQAASGTGKADALDAADAAELLMTDERFFPFGTLGRTAAGDSWG
ncbi:MAG: hypothetical protein WC889_10050, partial [Myxococcota bacterium]